MARLNRRRLDRLNGGYGAGSAFAEGAAARAAAERVGLYVKTIGSKQTSCTVDPTVKAMW